MASIKTERAMRFTGSIVLVFTVVTLMAYVGLRLYVGYGVEARERANAQQIEILHNRLESIDRDHTARYNELEAVLFGNIQPKVDQRQAQPAKPRQTRIEIWQLNRDKELRERIRQLERWRYEMEREP